MATPGGRAVPEALKKKILDRVQAGPDDPRCQRDYEVEGRKGFFAFGAYAAIEWEQVTRSMQLRVLQMARLSRGPVALFNTADGKPDQSHKAHADQPGQLVYYFQAVDRFVHQHPRERYMSALRFLNLSKSAGLHGMLGVFAGMRVRLAQKNL